MNSHSTFAGFMNIDFNKILQFGENNEDLRLWTDHLLVWEIIASSFFCSQILSYEHMSSSVLQNWYYCPSICFVVGW